MGVRLFRRERGKTPPLGARAGIGRMGGLLPALFFVSLARYGDAVATTISVR